MSLFNFFRRNKPAGNESATETITAPAVQVDRTLFVEDEAPELKHPVKESPNSLDVFLGKDFQWQGVNDGYNYHDTSYLDAKIAQIRAAFRLEVDKCMDKRRADLGELKIHLIDAEGISARLEAKLKEKIRQLEITIHELDTQKILSVENEGLVSTAIQSYRLGFIQGLEKYQQEKFFAESTGLFN